VLRSNQGAAIFHVAVILSLRTAWFLVSGP
jgi:hypothetical protein